MKAKCRQKKIYLKRKRDFAAGVYLSGPLPSYDSMPPPPLHTVYVYTVYSTYSHREGGGGGRDEPERRLERQQFLKLG
jgi:hypothetical protein